MADDRGHHAPGDDPHAECKGNADAERRLSAARAGSSEALGQLLDACRGYLLTVAQGELDPGLRAKGGASDMVQETFLEAQRDFAQFRGDSEAELLAWLRRMLLNNVANFARHYRATDKRQIGREIVLDAPGFRGRLPSLSGQGDPLAALPGDGPTPSAHVRTQEQDEAVQHALARLPEDYRRIILLRYQEERSFEEIGRLMERSENAARQLLLRAIERLQQTLERPP